MIVDDHHDIRRLLKQIINVGKSQSHYFVECESGEEAVRQYSECKPDLVLMDIELKAMDGLDAATMILNQNSAANILIVSSHNSPSVRRKAAEIPISGFISKDDLSQVYNHIYN